MAIGVDELELPPSIEAAPLLGPRLRAEWLRALCQRLCRVHEVELVVNGHIPREPVIYVSNHLGYLDPIVICSLVPCAPIAKREVASWPLVGALTRSANVIFVRRGDAADGARALRKVRQRLEAGVSVLNFPEGTTTRGDVLRFRRGVFGVARRLGVAVVPLALSFESPELCWVDDDGFVSHYARVVLGRAHRVHLEVGPLLYPRGRETAAELAERARAWIVAARSRLRHRAAVSIGSTVSPVSPVSPVRFPWRDPAPRDHAA